MLPVNTLPVNMLPANTLPVNTVVAIQLVAGSGFLLVAASHAYCFQEIMTSPKHRRARQATDADFAPTAFAKDPPPCDVWLASC